MISIYLPFSHLDNLKTNRNCIKNDQLIVKTVGLIYQHKTHRSKFTKRNMHKRVICESTILLYSENVKLIRSIICLNCWTVGEGMEQKEA